MDTQDQKNEKKTSWGCVGCLTIIVVIACTFSLIRHRISAPYRAIEKEYAFTNRQFPFDPHGVQELSREQLDRYIQIRSDLIPKIEAIASAIEAKRSEKAREGGGVGLAIRAGKELIKLDRELKAEHIAFLTQHKMSSDEYRWIARRTFAALWQGATSDRPELRKAWNRVSQKFRAGAPRIAKYRNAPPDLADRLALVSVSASTAEIALVERLQDKLFEPGRTLYQEVALLTEDKK